MKILMVCLGNICRSPLAEGILKDKIKKAGLDWEADSAGTNNYKTGCAPHNYSQKVARQHGIDISDQKCRQLTLNDIRNFDRIYVMDDQNYYNVKKIAGHQNVDKVDFLLNEIYPGQNKSIPDPWGGSEAEFYKVYKMIDEACEAIVSQEPRQKDAGKREKKDLIY